MHEYAITKNIVEIAVSEALKAGVKRITEIRLVIGDLAAILDESVSLYFDIISKDTPAEGARLVFIRKPARFVCTACGVEFDKPEKGFECPACGSMGRLTEGGREFYIESMEVEN